MKLTRRGFNGMLGTAILAETWKAAWPALGQRATNAAPDESDKLASLSLTEVSERIHARTVTSTQLVKALLDRINANGIAFLSHTVLDGKFVLRLAIGNIKTTETDLEQVWTLVQSLADNLK